MPKTTKNLYSLRLSTNRRVYSNTPLGRLTSTNSSLSSVHPIFGSSSYSNFLSPSHLPLKKIKPEPWQRLFQGKKEQELTMKKNTSHVNTIINEDFINLLNEHSLFDENSQSSFLPAPIQTHIDHLYEQIDDVALQLSEERFKHKQTRIKGGEIRSNQLKDQEKKFQELLKQKLLDYKNELKEQEEKYRKLMNEKQLQGFKREEKLRNELEHLKNSFHTYKVSLDREHAEQLQSKINEALATTKAETEDGINKKINDALLKQRKHMNEIQTNEIENIRKQHQKEITSIQKRFGDTTVLPERLESLSKELTLTKLELDETRERAINLSTQLKDLESQHIKTIRELNDYRMHFDEKTNKIEKLYTERVDQLY